MPKVILIEDIHSSADLENTLVHMGISGTIGETLSGEDELRDYLAHFGVKGMHWGRRKASYNDPPSGTGAVRMVRSGAPVAAKQTGGAKYLAKNNGSQKKAIAKTVGKAIVINRVIEGPGRMLVNNALKDHPSAKAGANIALHALSIGSAAYNARKVVQIHKAANKQKAKK